MSTPAQPDLPTAQQTRGAQRGPKAPAPVQADPLGPDNGPQRAKRMGAVVPARLREILLAAYQTAGSPEVLDPSDHGLGAHALELVQAAAHAVFLTWGRYGESPPDSVSASEALTHLTMQETDREDPPIDLGALGDAWFALWDSDATIALAAPFAGKRTTSTFRGHTEIHAQSLVQAIASVQPGVDPLVQWVAAQVGTQRPRLARRAESQHAGWLVPRGRLRTADAVFAGILAARRPGMEAGRLAPAFTLYVPLTSMDPSAHTTDPLGKPPTEEEKAAALQAEILALQAEAAERAEWVAGAERVAKALRGAVVDRPAPDGSTLHRGTLTLALHPGPLDEHTPRIDVRFYRNIHRYAAQRVLQAAVAPSLDTELHPPADLLLTPSRLGSWSPPAEATALMVYTPGQTSLPPRPSTLLADIYLPSLAVGKLTPPLVKLVERAYGLVRNPAAPWDIMDGPLPVLTGEEPFVWTGAGPTLSFERGGFTPTPTPSDLPTTPVADGLSPDEPPIFTSDAPFTVPRPPQAFVKVRGDWRFLFAEKAKQRAEDGTVTKGLAMYFAVNDSLVGAEPVLVVEFLPRKPLERGAALLKRASEDLRDHPRGGARRLCAWKQVTQEVKTANGALELVTVRMLEVV